MLRSRVGTFLKLLRLHYTLICVKTVLCLPASLFNDNAIADTPIRIKRIIVEKSEIAKRWDKEVALVKKGDGQLHCVLHGREHYPPNKDRRGIAGKIRQLVNIS